MDSLPKAPISIIIPTLNEEANIKKCLESVSWANEIFIVDCFSADNTISIAKEYGVKIYQNQWPGYSEQKNWALDNLPISNEWVLFLDADERVSTKLAEEIQEKIFIINKVVGYYVSRRLVFLGRNLKHAWWYPDRCIRLFKHRMGRFDSRIVHERVLLNGEVAYLKADLMHEDNRNLDRYIERHNEYSRLEAAIRFKEKNSNFRPEINPSLFGDWGQRRRALKKIWLHIPFRPIVRFIWIYFIRLGFLDGKQGFFFASLISIYEFFIDAKYFEITLKRDSSS